MGLISLCLRSAVMLDIGPHHITVSAGKYRKNSIQSLRILNRHQSWTSIIANARDGVDLGTPPRSKHRLPVSHIRPFSLLCSLTFAIIFDIH